MKIEHLAIWCSDLERQRHFYQHYFGAKANNRYHNPKKGFSSYFLSFDGGARLELMTNSDLRSESARHQLTLGYAHLAISVGGEQQVDKLCRQLVKDGLRLIDGPRRTGDGYYEAVILDPENNRLEITA